MILLRSENSVILRERQRPKNLPKNVVLQRTVNSHPHRAGRIYPFTTANLGWQILRSLSLPQDDKNGAKSTFARDNTVFSGTRFATILSGAKSLGAPSGHTSVA